MNPQQAAMMAQAQMQGGQPGQPQPNPMAAAAKEAVTMAVNVHNNSILVQAKPDKMAIITQMIEALDIPLRPQQPLAGEHEPHAGLPAVGRRSGADRQDLDGSRQSRPDDAAGGRQEELGDHRLRPAGRPRDDPRLVDKLTGSERKFEVIRLRRLAADYVAGTINVMLGSGPKKEQQRRPWYYGDSPQEEKKTGEFRVEADVEHNRLLLWANPVELTEVEGLLAKLGEMPAGGSGSTMRVIDSGDPKETQELLKRIQTIWPSIAPNALQAPAPVPGDC